MDELNDLRASTNGVLFRAGIRDEQICSLASSLNDNKACHIEGSCKDGSYNSCYTVIFCDRGLDDNHHHDDADSGQERWVMRFPTLPRLAYPVEKLRGEIATMKYLAERTTIPIPRVIAYGFGGDYPTGLPYIAMEHIRGETLLDPLMRINDEQRSYLYDQLADIFFQLRQQVFPHIGALTLTDDGSWRFGHNRPLNFDFSDAQLDGQRVDSIVPPSRTYDSTSSYCESLMTLEMIHYLRQRDRVEDEENARFQLFALHRFRDVIREWIAPEYDRGPFVLTHGDFLPGNVMVNDDLRIVAIIDWEYSHTVPLQLFVPPMWLHPFPRSTILSPKCEYAKDLDCLNQAVRMVEEKYLSHNAQNVLTQPPLSQLWQNLYKDKSFCIAHALLRRSYITDVCRVHFSNIIPADEQIKARVAPFFDSARNPEANNLRRLTQRKVEESKRFDALFSDEGARQTALERPRSPRPSLSFEDNRMLEMFLKGFEKSTEYEEKSRLTRTPFSFNDLHIMDHISRSCLLRDACLLTLTGFSCWILAKRWRLL